MTILAIQRKMALTDQQKRVNSPKSLEERLREARDQEAAEERARREHVIRRLQRA
jgi:hypothetical protein